MKIALKLLWMAALVFVLVLASHSTVDFVYRGF